MNTAIVSPSGAFAGVGFAVPVDEVNATVPQLIRDGKVTRPALGIRIAEDAQVRALGMQGVLVRDVLPGSAAEEAGMKPTTFNARGRVERFGDLIVGMEGEPVRNRIDLFRLLDRHKPGDSVRITVERESGRATLTVTLQTGT